MDANPVILEHRVAILEAELRKAEDRIRTAEVRGRRTLLWCIGALSGLTALVLAFGLTGTTQGAPAGPLTVKAPFTVVGNAGRVIFTVATDPNGGGIFILHNSSGASVLTGGSSSIGAGYISATVPNGNQAAYMGVQQAGAIFELEQNMHSQATLSMAKDNTPALTFWSSDGQKQIAYLGRSAAGNGHLLLNNRGGSTAVEAGTLTTDSGSVKTFAPTGAIGEFDGSGLIRLLNAQGHAIAVLETSSAGNGHFVLGNNAGVARVEAGILTNGKGSLETYGP
jgi:hypothetical protein